jgi:pyruvate dehydrogenase E1 component alpha subunit
MAQVKEKKTSKQMTGASNGLDVTTYRDWYETMLRIRRFEERALKMYSVNKIRGFLHVYIGQEAIAGAITSALRPTDPIVTGYRQHGIALCRGISSAACMAELFGKETGINKGKGGSMHFFSKAHHYFGGNGIVGAQIPIGTGIAFAEQYKGTENICLTMFGDGAARQGALHESFNMAMTWKLPVLYVVENNHYAMGTSITRTSNVTELRKLGLSYDMPASSVDGMDVIKTHYAMAEAAAHIRSGKGPYLLEINTYRYRGHSVSDPAKYRTPEELESYKIKDPIEQLKAYIISHKILSISELEGIDKAIAEEIDEAELFAENSSYPPVSELWTDNYIQKDYPFTRD